MMNWSSTWSKLGTVEISTKARVNQPLLATPLTRRRQSSTIYRKNHMEKLPKLKMKQCVAIWTPFMFSCVLSALTLGEHVFALSRHAGSGSNTVPSLPITFISFMPMCFFFVCIALHQLKKENESLKSELNER